MKTQHIVADLFEVVSGSTPSTTIETYWSNNGHGIKWITPKDLSALKTPFIEITERKITKEGLQSCSANIIPRDSLIISSRAPIGYVAILKDEMSCNQGCKALVPVNKEMIDPIYFYYLFLNSQRELNHLGSGSTFKELSKTKLEEFKINIHEITEQIGIGQLLLETDIALQKRKTAYALTDQFLQSTFLSMFGDLMGNDKNWKSEYLDRLVVNGFQNGLYVPNTKYGKGTPILRIDSFYDGFVDNIDSLKRVEIDEKTINLYSLKKNDIVINRVNSRKYLGKSAIIPGLKEPSVFESNMMRFSIDCERLEPLFLIYQLQQPHIRHQILRSAKDAVNQSSINQEDVKSFKIYIPPLALQQKFASIVADSEQLRQKQKQSEIELQNLFQALLQKYFE